MDTINTLSLCMQGIISAGLVMRIIFCAIKIMHEEAHMDDDKLYIPYGLSIDQEYFPGFGGRELRQFFVGILGSGIIGALLLIFTGQLIALIISLMIGAAGSMMAVRKDPYTRISVVGQISDIIHFHKSQKHYKYIYTAPWDIK